MKTSYFAKSGNDPNAVSIAAYSPHWYKGKDCPLLCPPWSIVSQYKKGLISEEQYEELYVRHVLSVLDPKEVAARLGPEAILLCYEGSKDFCHRHIVAEWFRAAGIDIEEVR